MGMDILIVLWFTSIITCCVILGRCWYRQYRQNQHENSRRIQNQPAAAQENT